MNTRVRGTGASITPLGFTTPQQEKEKLEADQKAKEEAHTKISIFNNICELYNRGELDDPHAWAPVLEVYQRDVQAAQKVIVYLYKKENCEATRRYMLYAAKLLIRFSSLIHNGRKETPEELVDHIHSVEDKYGNLTIFGEEI